MDLSTIIGLLAGIGMIAVAIADAGGGLDIFTSGSAYLIVFVCFFGGDKSSPGVTKFTMKYNIKLSISGGEK